ncbi:hypothetical protein [Streptomyces sp. NPDC046978]|uniref:hypothetical protein n=1 Tax=unclassified Streptomyces TaxID=2593676 RepID=UPI0033C754FB
MNSLIAGVFLFVGVSVAWVAALALCGCVAVAALVGTAVHFLKRHTGNASTGEHPDE